MIGQDTLYNLLPQFQRARDTESGFALLALSRVLESQAMAIHGNMDALLDNWFIETCAQWLVPYLGQLVGIDDIHSVDDNIPAQRLRVAEAMRLRGGRGTLVTITQAVTAATGWPALVVDQGAHLVGSQSMRDPRPRRGCSFPVAANPPPPRIGPGHGAHVTDVRLPNLRDLAGGAQDTLFAPNTLTVYLWRIRSYPMPQAQPRSLGQGLWALHPFGCALQLFSHPTHLIIRGQNSGLWDKPHPVGRTQLKSLLAQNRMDKAGLALTVRRSGQWESVPANEIHVADLSQKPEKWRGDGSHIVVDPETGLLFLPADIQAAAVDYAYGFSMEMGGGPYDRGERLAEPQPDTTIMHVAKGAQGDGWYDDLAKALAHMPHTGGVLIHIHDNGLYEAGHFAVPVGDREVVIQAANGRRPAILGNITVTGGEKPGTLALSGLLIQGTVTPQKQVHLWALDCTMMPAETGAAAILAEDGGGDMELHYSICGPVRIMAPQWRMAAGNTILDGLGGKALSGTSDNHPALRPVLRHVTVFGDMAVTAPPDAGENLLTGRLLLPGRTAPVPPGDQAVFLSRRYGDFGYGQLGLDNPATITAGAEDGGELGAFHGIAQAVRLKNLQAALAGSVPQGMHAGVIFVT
jgi:hypothetical protein